MATVIPVETDAFAPKRLVNEIETVASLDLNSFRDMKCTTDMRRWFALILPDDPPYNKGAFKVEINFPIDYPFKPPRIQFNTKIYHPNFDQRGQVCLPIIGIENWKPTTRMDTVILTLIALVNEPDPDNPMRPELAEEYVRSRKRFMKAAEDFTRKKAEKRPEEDPKKKKKKKKKPPPKKK